MIVKKVQNENNQNILLIVHDERGHADDIITKLYKFIEDQVIYHQINTLPTEDLVRRYFLSEMTDHEIEDDEEPEE